MEQVSLTQTSLGSQPGDSIEHVSEKFRMLLSMLGTRISKFGNQPHFQPGTDMIVMPERQYLKHQRLPPGEYNCETCGQECLQRGSDT